MRIQQGNHLFLHTCVVRNLSQKLMLYRLWIVPPETTGTIGEDHSLRQIRKKTEKSEWSLVKPLKVHLSKLCVDRPRHNENHCHTTTCVCVCVRVVSEGSYVKLCLSCSHSEQWRPRWCESWSILNNKCFVQLFTHKRELWLWLCSQKF